MSKANSKTGYHCQNQPVGTLPPVVRVAAPMPFCWFFCHAPFLTVSRLRLARRNETVHLPEPENPLRQPTDDCPALLPCCPAALPSISMVPLAFTKPWCNGRYPARSAICGSVAGLRRRLLRP